ncbi:MAG TPA: FG-GAP-like repeat-containing protein, partial [Bacteroidia bacterium]|nr:FG-GAP-like repeat-containing protein [Bacteroidia bacterium]
SEMVDAGQCAFPLLFDHNGDGLLDLVLGNHTRKVTATNMNSGLVLYENTGTATSPEFTLTSRNYAGLTNAFNPAILGMAPTLGDLDGDGDPDMLIGDSEGRVHYVQNTAPTGQAANFSNVTVQYFGIDIGQNATPALADIDRDGDLDLILGDISGNLNYFENTGTAQAAVFSNVPDDDLWGGVDTQPICCTGYSVPYIFQNPQTNRFDMIVGSQDGNLLYYNDFESELGSTFTLDQGNFGEIQEGERTAIAGADLNNDNVWEWVVGNVRGGIGFYSGNGLITTSPDVQLPRPADWQVFPNPSSGIFGVQLSPSHAAGTMRISVLNLHGQSLLRQDHVSAAKGATVDMSAFAPGIYFLRMDLNGVFGGVKRIEVMR